MEITLTDDRSDLRAYIAVHRIDQRELARTIGISPQLLSDLLTGNRTLTSLRRSQIEEALKFLRGGAVESSAPNS